MLARSYSPVLCVRIPQPRCKGTRTRRCVASSRSKRSSSATGRATTIRTTTTRRTFKTSRKRMNFRESSLYLNLVSSLHESCRTLQYVVETTPSTFLIFVHDIPCVWLIDCSSGETFHAYADYTEVPETLGECLVKLRCAVSVWPFVLTFLVGFTLLLFRVLSTDENLPIQTSNCWSGGTFRVHSPKAVDLTLRKLSWTFERNVLRWRMWILNGCK